MAQEIPTLRARDRDRPAGGAPTGAAWSVVLPVKGGPAAKSRLGAGPALAAAIVADCLAAVLGCPEVARVLVVSSDPQTAARARALGAEPVPERQSGSGLGPAVRDGIRAAPRRAPVAVVLGDLPALRPDDLGTALRAAAAALGADPAAPMVVVPDADGTGTVLLAAREPAHLDPAFGPDSAREHVRRGAVRLDLALPRLRRDVDTPDDLLAALRLGCGPRTRAELARAGRLAALTAGPGRPPQDGTVARGGSASRH